MPSLTEQATRIADAYTPPETGRHSDIGDAVAVRDLLLAVSQGNYIETSCLIAGISKQTLYQWLKRAEQDNDPNSPHVRFRDALKRAEAMAEAQDVANVRAAGRLPQYWAASATHLERRHPERWAKRSDLDAGPKVIVQIGVSAENAIMVTNPVNVISNYQTQTDSEALCLPTLAAPYLGANEAKAEGESATDAGLSAPAAPSRAEPGRKS